jgi:hypothetical protein
MSVRCCNLDFVTSALWLTPKSVVYDTCVQHVSPRPFVIVITVSDGGPFNQALLLPLWWSYCEVSPSPRDSGGNIGAL